MVIQQRFLSFNDAVIDTPSRRSGVPLHEEKLARNAYVQLITDTTTALLPDATTQATIAGATATMYVHRFYMCKSLIDHEVWYMTMAAIFLALKVEDTPRKLPDIIRACYEIRYNKPKEQIHELTDAASLDNIRDQVLRAEYLLLAVLGFQLKLDHPYQAAKQWMSKNNVTDSHREFQITAYSYINDTYRTTLLLQYSAEEVATACMYLASIVVDSPPPDGLKAINGKINNITQQTVISIAQQMVDFYQEMVDDQGKSVGQDDTQEAAGEQEKMVTGDAAQDQA